MSGETKSEWQTLLDSWAEAIVANDPARIAAFMEPDWTLVTPEAGPVRREAFLEAVATGALTHEVMTFDVTEVRPLGDAVVVVAHGKNSGTYRGQAFSADEWVTEIFVRREGGWRCAVTALTPRVGASAEDRTSLE